MIKYCRSCNTDTEWDETPVCTQCGCFFKPEDDNVFFTEAIEFCDTKKVGTTVSGPEHTRIRGSRGKNYGGSAVETTWETFEKGKRVVLNIATSLNLPQNIINSANNTYRLGLYLKFTSGRTVEIVAASCLYIACRLNGHPVLLADFADNISVKVPLGTISRVCIRLAQSLSITLPPVLGGLSESSRSLDPLVYLRRFADKLGFGDKAIARTIAATALRILRRMQKDWIHWGRHPAGLFGAALLIASRLHGYRRTQMEVSNVVYIGNTTIGKRVTDFANTPSAGLSMSEFDNCSLEAQNPPSFERGRIKWADPNQTVRWPSELPSRPEEVKKWINEGMGVTNDDDFGAFEMFETGGREPFLEERKIEWKDENQKEWDEKELDGRADFYLNCEKEFAKKDKIWRIMNRKWIEKRKEKAVDEKREKKVKGKKGKKRGMSATYKMVMKEREKMLQAKKDKVDFLAEINRQNCSPRGEPIRTLNDENFFDLINF